MSTNKAYQRRWEKLNRARRSHRAWVAKLRKDYGLSVEQYEEILRAQGGVCALCGAAPGKRRLSVDHDHRAHRVRAILCDACNLRVGRYEEDTEWLPRVMEYLRAHS